MEKICVAVRLRPHVSQASFNGTYWNVDENRISLHKAHGTPISGLSYTFDHVFDESCTNSRVYEPLTRDIIYAAVEGFNGTAFAYGQTSSGKTFTMNGSEADPGIIHRAVKDIYGRIQMVSDREFLIRVSYMEIYNEEINDLLAAENQKLQIHESLERGVFVAGLREEIVSNAEQVLKLIELGEANRHFGNTNMNARSSRSHTIFRMVIESKGTDLRSSSECLSTDAIRVSVLNLVDLAGSERIAKTGADGVRLKEGKHINKSLMVLGNVINKLSDGTKQRGHIPYRDSKLTRILQPALGGNAKTSIICTIAPEEIHIEETKGTLQFASRAKHITNCVQVNEILTEAALLKRQKLEIEELRNKLQGSHSEVLEQEILKLRNDLLKYEVEREKLEMELREERKSHKERDNCIREQQMKIENLSSLVSLSESERNCSQGQDSVTETLKEECSDGNNKFHGDSFSTPCFKEAPYAFVAKRSNYSTLADYSPLPDNFSNVADEDMWLKMNNGYVPDLDSLQMTPARRLQSFPLNGRTPDCPNDKTKQEIQNIERQLELAISERNDLKKKNEEQIIFSNQLTAELSELQKEVKLIREIPRHLRESIVSCKNIYKDVLSSMQCFIPDRKSSTLLSSTNEIGRILFTTLEADFSMAMDGRRYFPGNDSLIEEHHQMLREGLETTIRSLISSETPTGSQQPMDSLTTGDSKVTKDSAVRGIDSCNEKLSSELNDIRERYHELQKKLDSNNQLLEVYKQKHDCLDKEFQLLKVERDSLREMLSESSQKLELVSNQKDVAMMELDTEVQRRKDLEEGIKQFGVAYARRQSAFVSLSSEIRSKTEKLRARNPVSLPNSLGC